MALLAVHHPLVFIVGIIGNVISFSVYLAPLSTFYRVYQKKSTEGFQSVPYVAAFFSAMLWIYYAFIKTNAILLITINSLGCIIEALYIAIYLTYAPKKARVTTVRVLVGLNIGLFSIILLLGHLIVRGSSRVKVIGWICASISIIVFAAPLSIIAQVVRTRSVEFMPLSLSLSLTLSAMAWLSYGLLVTDYCVAVPNIVGLVLGFLQIVLYGLYKNSSKPANKQSAKLPEEGVPVDAKPACNKETEPAAEENGLKNKAHDETAVDTAMNDNTGNGVTKEANQDHELHPAEDAV